MNEHPFRALLDLVNFDQALLSFTNKKDFLEKEIDILQNQASENDRVLDQLKQHVFELQKNVDMQELELKVLDDQERSKKMQLDAVHSHKEYVSIKSEIEGLQRAQTTREQELLFMWNKLEHAQKDLLIQLKEHAKKAQEIEAKIAEYQKQIDEIKQHIDQQKEQRIVKEKGVLEEWLEKYAMMRLRVPNPVVPSANGSCSACFYTITGPELARLHKGAVLQCKGCFRLLYQPEAIERIHPS